uniref:Predicted Gal4-like transcriptional regulator n=1 Tax=Beauveria bassiana TaxID=176275 RepID=D1FVE6_BEABA|nr:predicted Gal4-like transcriptional regulator [Beauveria bassiana]
MDLPLNSKATLRGASVMPSPQTGSSSTDTQLLANKTQNRPRHRKTRTGCFNCKRRRIKCKEERPACHNCVKSGYTCEYPVQARLYAAPDQVPRFTMLDMHFFQHFLLQCRPVYPLGNEQTLTCAIQLTLSHQHDFLLYAVLGFAAADLEANGATNSSLSVPAMTYRCKAIQLFRKAIASFQEPEKTLESIMSSDQGSALVASCYLLIGQSRYLGDGIQDFMTLTRGSASLRAEMIRLRFPPLFRNLEPEDSIETMRRYLQEVPPLDKPWIGSGEASLDMLKMICADKLQLAYVTNLEKVLQYSKVDCFKVYTSIMGHFIWWQSLPFGDFQRIIDLTDQVNILLATHWVALMMVMSFLHKASTKINNDSKKASDTPAQGSIGVKAQAQKKGKCTEPWYYWLACMNRWINDDYQKFNTWPQWVQDRLDEDATYFES